MATLCSALLLVAEPKGLRVGKGLLANLPTHIPAAEITILDVNPAIAPRKPCLIGRL
jgi:hypothetical protein